MKFVTVILLFCLGLLSKVNAQSGKDTLAIRQSVDSLIGLKQKALSAIVKQPGIVTSRIAVLKKYPANALLFQCYQLLADANVRNGENELAKLYIDTCFAMAHQLNNKKFIGKTKYINGIYLKFNGKSDAAIKNWYEALTLFREIKDEKNELGALAAIAREYGDLKQYDKAEEYLKQIITRKLQLNDELSASNSYNTLANVYADTKRYAEAIDYFNKALAISYKYNDTINLAYTYNNLARVYNKQEKLTDAEKSWNKSYSLFMRTGDAFGIAMIINNMAYIEIKLKRYQKGIEYAKQAVAYSTEHDIQLELLRAHSNLLDAYYGLNDFKNGFKEYEIIIDMKDAQFNKDVASAMTDAEQKYKSKIQQDSIMLLNADKKVNSLLLDEERTKTFNYKMGLLLTLLFTGTVAALGFFIIKNKKAKAELQHQAEINQLIFETEQAERERIARDLHDSVGQKLSVVKMKLSMQEANYKDTGDLLDQAIQDVRAASHNLMPEDLKKGLIVAVEEIIDQINYSQHNTNIELKVSPAIQQSPLSKQTELYVYRIIQEIVTNALKYANAKHIIISMDVVKNHLQLLLSDDGIGFNTNPDEPTEGIGLKNIRTRIEQLKGNMQIISKTLQGTSYTIEIPL